MKLRQAHKFFLHRRTVWMLSALLSAVLFSSLLSRYYYHRDLQAVSNSQQVQVFTVEKGSGVKSIAFDLKKDKLIRSEWAFQLYVRKNDLASKLQAGTYALSPSQDTQEIVKTLTGGRVSTRLVTILPGRRVDQVRADFINYGFAPAAVDAALDPARYSDIAIMAIKPADITTLEGLLWPDSFQKGPETDPADIIRQSIEETGQKMTPDIQAAFAAEGLTPYQGLVLASIVVQEVNKPADQAQAAQVFLSRLKGGTMLGSDVTARYGSIKNLGYPSLTYDSPYNTHLHTGLPPTPISSINESALNASAHPAGTNWLFFVTGDDGTTYFSHTLEEHQALTSKYCLKLCSN